MRAPDPPDLGGVMEAAVSCTECCGAQFCDDHARMYWRVALSTRCFEKKPLTGAVAAGKVGFMYCAGTKDCQAQVHTEGCERERDPNATALPFTPETLSALANKVQDFRVGVLLCDVDAAGAAPVAEQHFLLALSLLEQAQSHLKLAAYDQAAAVAGRR